jgi:hypothetical protein
MEREVTDLNKGSKGDVQYGDITSKIISPFEMHLPVSHEWDGDEMGWIMREYYTPIDVLKDKLMNPATRSVVKKSNGWYLENLEKVGGYNVQNLPLWWWERLSDVVEGPGPSIYVGTPEQWSGYTVVRILDRKPSPKWPRGRTVVVAGDQIIYDSPKKIGARAYDPRWPNRWHPYTRYVWEPQPGSMYGRSLISKLLPKLKRVNSIDTTLIMYRRTVPMSAVLVPKGANPVEDIWSGRPATVWDWDPRKTQNHKPEFIYPPPYPEGLLNERQQQIEEMEMIAGTEEVLRGQRPVGVNSAMMLDAMRRQTLASKSPTLQNWDESLQTTGVALLMETMKHVKDDSTYAERIRILAREKHSRLSIDTFSGDDLSDNYMVRVDTAAQALVSKEAKRQMAIEFIQYSQHFTQLPLALQESLIEYLGWEIDLHPQGPDVNRAKDMISWIRQGEFERVIPFPEDDPYVFHETLVNASKEEGMFDWPQESQELLFQLIDLYKQQIEKIEQQQLQMQTEMSLLSALASGEGESGPK